MAAIGSGTWALSSNILNLSEANNWKEAVREWSLVDIEILDPGEFETCLCGHNPIRELCHIQNTLNHRTATVGNHCIQRFNAAPLQSDSSSSESSESDTDMSSESDTDMDSDEDAEPFLVIVPKAIQSAKRILDDPTVSANQHLIEYARSMKIFTQENADFYSDIWRKRNLSDNQRAYKKSLNRVLLYEVALTARAAYQRLKVNLQKGNAGPKLVKYAFEKKVLTEKDKNFYLQIWKLPNDKISSKQVDYKVSLNRRIVQHLKAELDS